MLSKISLNIYASASDVTLRSRPAFGRPRKKIVNFFNSHWTGQGWNQDGAHSIACRAVCVKARDAKIGVYVVYHLINMWMKKN